MKNRSMMLGFLMLATTTANALAADVEVRCEQRLSPARARVSVDVRNIAPGTYAAAIVSDQNATTSGPKVTIGDEVAFDFDSNRKDILAGATSIGNTFVRSESVAAQILNVNGAVVAEGGATCRVR